MARLETTQPVAGAEIIALAGHVDYWDFQGWRDRFASAAFTARQRQYAVAFRIDGPYTPQMVVDGAAQFTGNDPARAQAAIAEAAQQPKSPIRLEFTPEGTLRVRIENPPARAADVLLAITESGLVSDVRKGENAGRTLRHEEVVRRLTLIGRTKAGQSFTAQPALKIASEWKAAALRAVVFIQERGTGRVLGAAAAPLSRRSAIVESRGPL